ncbi:glycosytransferase [Pseudomonas subflava]|uniref:glycosytransferase n=1 Tax=Pseudomonas subflava TaxID=2952933 RepID=UPI00207981EF|nr:glycosytransferase [Pseudomonas subflava]
MKKTRAMWLINHTTLRKFEAAQFKAAGIDEIYTPKSFPYDEGNLSANVEYSLDSDLSITEEELEILNAQNWYESPSAESWEIANRHFDIVFVPFFLDQLKSVTLNFRGIIVLRVFGHAAGQTYSQLIYQYSGERLVRQIKSLGRRFWFGAGYEHLYQIEQNFLASRNCFLPVGLSTTDRSSEWTGECRKILFVCPRIASSSHFGSVFNDFLINFGEFPYTIGGAQPIHVDNPNVIGFVSREEHERNMREHRVMFYHSQQPNHIHYHPFEAVAAGMPLIFMANGLLDRMGGVGLPGRCKSISEAKQKIRKILSGDQNLINSIRASQGALLAAIKAENCAPAWQSSFKKILSELQILKNEETDKSHSKKKKIAIIFPKTEKEIDFQVAKILANTIFTGSKLSKSYAEVIFLYPERNEYEECDFIDLHKDIKCRSFNWKKLSSSEAKRAMRYSGHEGWEPTEANYLTVDDGIRQIQDCDLWLVVSDLVDKPLLPIRPTVHFIYDHPKRQSENALIPEEKSRLNTIRAAEKILVTTQSTFDKAAQYAGVPTKDIIKLPYLMLPPANTSQPDITPYYFILDVGTQQRLKKALQILEFFYAELDGSLQCLILAQHRPQLLDDAIFLQKTKDNIHWRKSPDLNIYDKLIAKCAFIWNMDSSDMGMIIPMRAANAAIPTISIDTPAAREIASHAPLDQAWMTDASPRAMAQALKSMEDSYPTYKRRPPTTENSQIDDIEMISMEYWRAIQECL